MGAPASFAFRALNLRAECAHAIVAWPLPARTQGRLLFFGPEPEGSKKAIPSSHPEVSARFVKESAVKKRGTFLPDVDMIDVNVRQENLAVKKEWIQVAL